MRGHSYVGPLLATYKGNKYILAIGTEYFFGTEAYSLQNQTAETVARTFVDEFICRYGSSDVVYTDQRWQFEAQFFQEM